VCVDPKKERLIYATKDIGRRSGKRAKDLASLSHLREDNLSDLFRNLYGVEPPVRIHRRSTVAVADISWVKPCSQPEKISMGTLERRFRKSLCKRVRSGFRGYQLPQLPVTVPTISGPARWRSGITKGDGEEVDELRRWFSSRR
jgi:hypothetical protein